MLSEEAPPDLHRLDYRRVWIIDRLDGTGEYSEPEHRADWAVHVALCIDGAPAVALPARTLTYDTGMAPLVETMQQRIPRIVVSRTRPTVLAEKVCAAVGAELVTMGSAGAKSMAVLRGEADAYLSFGAMAEWVSCAGSSVCSRRVTRIPC